MLIERYAFSLAMAFNMFSMTLYMIFQTLLGNSEMAADVGIIQGASLAVFMAFSANARNRILGEDEGIILRQQFYFRCIIAIPLIIAAYFLSRGLVEVSGLVILLLIFRRCSEWFAELQISERENLSDKQFAVRFSILQSISLLMLTGSIGNESEMGYLFILSFWAIAPLLQSMPYIRRMYAERVLPIHFGDFLPHLGSSWVISITTYTFRVLLVLLVGRTVGGILFSAYAIGGMLNAIYVYALGPSLALQAKLKGSGESSRLMMPIVCGILFCGVCIVFASYAADFVYSESQLFSLTIGYSLIGAGFMIMAHRYRIHMLQTLKTSVFVPDVLSNIFLVATVPFAFFLFGAEILSMLFLWSALLALAFYSYSDVIVQRAKMKGYVKYGLLKVALSRQPVQVVILILIFSPIFYQLNGGIFNSQLMTFSSLGVLSLLPLPLSSIFSFVGVILLIQFDRAHFSTAALFIVFICMLLTTFAVSSMNDSGQVLGKLILLMQYILPMFALVLGQSYIQAENPYLRFEAILLYIIALIVPAEVCATFLQGTDVLSPYLYLFSIYQHQHYVPGIFVGGYLLAVYSFFGTQNLRRIILLLSPTIGIYAILSQSVSAVALLIGGVVLAPFFLQKRRPSVVLAPVLVITSMALLLVVQPDSNHIINDSSFIHLGKNTQVEMAEKVHYWQVYITGVFESTESFFFGHEHLPHHLVVRSAYNYYLGLAYNFGVIALIPFIILIIVTMNEFYKRHHLEGLSSSSIALGILVLFFLLIDNSFMAPLRQPYPGIVIFFMWGVLLSRLSETHNRDSKFSKKD